ncbi:hypothetical protein N7492_002976 [Penicillium capsulatum]|uniref:J domain-containing protein n=1 Tax=Penicillium capsulatum TaxID=69766 RepID=A0A9W9IMB3_9EURO|nr:hypothetical protein N7492_002976 [Penicillium capsulatum]KAJ6122433.1 hypothetical protein N7512_004898 [Penicillium capsulatum]
MPPRTAVFLFHPSHKTSRSSAPLPGTLTSQHTITRKRPQPRTRHANPTAYPHVCFFSSTNARLAHEQNYYEILDLPITASAGEIKKQFYALSLRHHPDRNRTDPTASQRFAHISAAYNVLGNASKRATYDHDHGFHHAQASPAARGPGQHPMGSHSSYSANLHHKGGSYAGSRPASGLSSRRGAFRGPPPSFYAQGGYGATGRTAEGSYSSSSSGSETRKGQGYDPEDPTGFVQRNPLHYFNARGHFRTQSAEDARRRERRSKVMRETVRDEMVVGEGGQFGGVRFVICCGILIIAGAMSGWCQWPVASSKPDRTRTVVASENGGKMTKHKEVVAS